MELGSNYGIISLLPMVLVVGCALVTKRTLESFILGSILGFIILDGPGFFMSWYTALQEVIGEQVWFILLLATFGIIIQLFEASGGAIGFSRIGVRVAKSRSSSLLVTFILGVIIFVDDYLNNLAIGVSMRNVTDRYKVSREYLAYNVNTTASIVCVLVPISTWGVYMTELMHTQGVEVGGSAMMAYIQAIPFMFYPIAALICVLLYNYKILPIFGPMKKAEARAAAGDVYPESYHKSHGQLSDMNVEEMNEKYKNARAINFIIPMAVLVAITIITSDVIIAALACIVVCFFMYIPQKVMKPSEFGDNIVKGVQSMIPITVLVMICFILLKANERLGLASFVIETVEPLLNPAFLPIITFLVTCFITYATGSLWQTAAIMFPIVIPLAFAVGTNVILTSAAVVSGAAFSSHLCFYVDAVMLVSSACEIEPTDYATTVTPLCTIPFGIACILFLVFGFIV